MVEENYIFINQNKYTIGEEDLSKSLLDYLRYTINFFGTKNGCGEGTCGACTVLVGHKAQRACRTPLKKVLGKSVLTIEGISTLKSDGTRALHPMQQAFIDAGAVQCGFCTPGMIMQSLDLLFKNREPNREEIRKALRGNICRCTGYQTIVDAVELGSQYLKGRDILDFDLPE